MTVTVRSTLETAAGALVTARLVGPSTWTTHHSEVVSPVTTTSASDGSWALELAPQSSLRDPGSYWLIEHAYRRHAVIVPDAGPVYVDDIEVSTPGYPLPGAPSVYLTRDELGQPDGPASLGSDGKVPTAQLPASSGGEPADATTLTNGVVRLAGDLAGTAAAPTVPGLAALTSTVTALASSTTTALAAKADAAATNTALAGKGSKLVVRAAYVTSGSPGGDAPPNTSGSWAKLAGVGELVIPAAAGDYVEVDLAFVLGNAAASSVWDIGLLSGSSIVWTSSSGTATPSGDGDPGTAPFAAPVRPFMSAGGWLVVGAPHLDGGNLRFVLLSKSDGGGSIFYSTSNPFRWRAQNHGPVS